jgi:pimeloyl-ACP methyl ester carboxylesterase
LNKFFFHFGPGGHARIEENWQPSNKIDFKSQDLSRLSQQPSNFNALIEQYKNLLENSPHPLQAWAHSFGCDALFTLAHHFPEYFAEIHLIAPIADLEKGFINICQTIARRSKNDNLKKNVEKILSAYQQDKLWDCLFAVAQDEEFPRSYWHQEANFEKWMKLQKLCPEMDMAYWAQFLMAYLPKQKLTFNKDIKVPTTVYLGKHDPYLREWDRQFWLKKIDKKNIVICEQSSHFPHLEESDTVLFLDSFKNK